MLLGGRPRFPLFVLLVMDSVHDDSIAIDGFEFIVARAQMRVEVNEITALSAFQMLSTFNPNFHYNQMI